jgi:fatty-acyl-CoA synthase
MTAAAPNPSRSADPRRHWVEVTTLGDLLVRAAALWPDKEAIVFPDSRRTYAEFLARAETAARSLLGLGVRRGDRVAILMPNCLDFLDVQFGAFLIGASALTVNARFKTRELSHVIRDSAAPVVITTDLIGEYVDFVPLLRQASADRPETLRELVLLGDSSPEGFLDRAAFDAAADGIPVEEVHRLRERVRIRDEAMLMYTSGTTSDPKGVVQTHEALARTSIAAVERWRLTEDDRFWNPLPMFHMGGVFPLYAHMWVGATVITLTHFDPTLALRQMEEERATFAYPTFPTITQPIINHPDFASTDLSGIRLVNDCAGPDVLRGVQEKFGPKASVVTLFGMTECCGGVSWSAPDDPLEKRMMTGGLPFRGTEVRIVDPETDEELPRGERGEITVRGPGLFDRYLNDPEKTAEAMRGGWFHTGDLGRMDPDGRLTYLGRLKDMLKVGGENVAAIEIESYLGTHPAVQIAQVVGVPDPKYLEVPAAFVELVPGKSVTEEELVEFCRDQIASFKIPRYVRFVTEWPLSGTKIQKFRLREEMLDELGVQDDAPAGAPVSLGG